jgi:hypothetical protein
MTDHRLSVQAGETLDVLLPARSLNIDNILRLTSSDVSWDFSSTLSLNAGL